MTTQMRTRALIAGAAFGLLSPCVLAHPFVLNVSSGSASITSVSASSPWAVEITVTAGSPAVFTLTTTDANTALQSVTVECDADGQLTINETSTGSFASVGDVLEASSSSPESFEINRIDISGSLGRGGIDLLRPVVPLMCGVFGAHQCR